jgi:hypothetical protein
MTAVQVIILMGVLYSITFGTIMWFAGYYKGLSKREKDDDLFADMKKTQIGLSKEDWDLLHKVIKDNPEPGEKIRELFKKYKK